MLDAGSIFRLVPRLRLQAWEDYRAAGARIGLLERAALHDLRATPEYINEAMIRTIAAAKLAVLMSALIVVLVLALGVLGVIYL